MAWEKKANKLMMGKFVRAKAERMVLITFQGEPIEAEGKNFKQEVVDELQFPVAFYDERSVAEKYKEGEAVRMVLEGKHEDKVMPVQGGPLLRALMDEHNEESIMGRTFILSHVGAAKDTVYKLREIRVPKQTRVAPLQDVEDEEEDYEPVEDKEEQDAIAEEKKKTPRRVPRAARATITVPPEDHESIKPKFDSEGHMLPTGQSVEEDPEKAKFKAKVKAHAAKAKKQEAKLNPPDEPIEHDFGEDEGDEELIHNAESAV